MTNRFEGKTALIAGGTGGLGRAVTVAFLQEGARVGVTYRAEQELQSLQAAAGTNASFLTGWRADVTNEKEMADVVQKIGSLDILVNAVGGYAGGTALWDTASETFERMMLLNVRSGFVLARLIVPAMVQRGAGSVVNIASRAAVDHAAGASAYAASKAAAVAMMDSLAADVLGHGVRVNTVLPSIIDTEANRKAMPGADFTKWPKPEEIARVILFLCSDDAKLIHGASIPVYGANG
ncbi:MAG TPA: SDR family NAD(P)-dependent oxidoreductase [Terracidiphilus sp.]|jgi:NAD(P)-dependent dehydrogenase (short-subunit alcohol dehydrogenase family)|nr:SDR family NAD(P)-dependent oxidoreductase [Terracidiphilus sp.]